MEGSFGLQFHGYNQGFEPYYKRIFSEIKGFEVDPVFFDNYKERTIRQMKNWKLNEPYERAGQYVRNTLASRTLTIEQRIAYLEAMDLDTLKVFQKRWLNNLTLEWLVQGHLTQAEALEAINNAEAALNFKTMDKSLVNKERCVRLKDRTVYQQSKVNEDKNVNNCIITLFAHCL